MEQTVAQINPQVAPVIVYKGLPVATTETLASFYTVQPKDIRNTFQCCAKAFVKGDHFFRLENDELYDFNNRPENKGNPDSQTISLTLWTRRGAALLAKLLSFDEAWTAYEHLENTYFKVQPIQQETIAEIAFKASHIDIKQAVQRLVSTTGDSATWIYYRLKAQFNVNSYKAIPPEQCVAAVEYLKKLEDEHFDMIKKSKLNNLAILAGDTTNRVMDHYHALHREIERLGGTYPVRRDLDEQTIVRAVVTRMVDCSRMFLTFNSMDGKARVSFVPNDSWILHSENIVNIIRDSSGVDRKLLPIIINAATDRLACR